MKLNIHQLKNLIKEVISVDYVVRITTVPGRSNVPYLYWAKGSQMVDDLNDPRVIRYKNRRDAQSSADQMIKLGATVEIIEV